MSYTTTNTIIENPQILIIETQEDELKIINGALQKKQINQEAWEIFHNQYKRFVFSIANKILQDEDEAEEATQEVFTKLIKQYSKYDQKQPFKPWLAKLTKNLCLNKIKKNKKNSQINYIGGNATEENSGQENDFVYFNAPEETKPNAIQHAINQELADNVRKVLENLKPEFRQVIELKYLEGLKYSEIAEKMKIPIGTVMSRIFNAKNKIREECREIKNEFEL